MKTSHWHGNVKITARSGGAGLGALLALVLALAAVAAVAYALVAVAADVSAVLDYTVPGVIAFALLTAGARHAIAEAWVSRLAARTERRYQARQAELRRTTAPQVSPAAAEPLRVTTERVEELPAPPPRTDLPWDREPVELDGRWSA